MTQGGFVAAMAATVSLADYEKPTEIIRSTRRWTIVSRFGPCNEYLTVSVADPIEYEQAEPPIGLAPARTVLGILLSESERDSESMFLLVRQLPREIEIAGNFFPTEGYARLEGTLGTLRLRSEGRAVHSYESLALDDTHIDVGDPAAGVARAMGWHIEAIRRPWAGEFFAAARH